MPDGFCVLHGILRDGRNQGQPVALSSERLIRKNTGRIAVPFRANPCDSLDRYSTEPCYSFFLLPVTTGEGTGAVARRARLMDGTAMKPGLTSAVERPGMWRSASVCLLHDDFRGRPTWTSVGMASTGLSFSPLTASTREDTAVCLLRPPAFRMQYCLIEQETSDV